MMYVLARLSCLALVFLASLSVTSPAELEERLDSIIADGIIYSNVTVITRTETHISFKHSGGFASVRLISLAPSAQTKVGYTPPAPPKTVVDHTHDLYQSITERLNDPTLQATLQFWEKEIRTEVQRVLSEDDRVIIYSVVGGVVCIYILFCLAAVKICKKTTVRPGLYVWLPGFQWISLLRAAGMSPWNFLLLLIPPINLIVMIVWCFKICRTRQKSQALGFLLLVPGINILVYFYLAFSSQKNAGIVHRHPQRLRLSLQH